MDGYGETALIAWIVTFMFIGAFSSGVSVGADKEKSFSEGDAEEAKQWGQGAYIAMAIGIVIWFIVFW
jgi:hypothetical protein